jgi:phosphohistidine phosphatase
VIEEGLFMAEPRRLLARLRRLDDSFETVLVVGHNPGLEALATGLAGSGKTGLLATLKTKFPTAAVAVIDLPVDHWTEAKFGTGELVAFVRPADLD